jgi:hypothetical protein
MHVTENDACDWIYVLIWRASDARTPPTIAAMLVTFMIVASEQPACPQILAMASGLTGTSSKEQHNHLGQHGGMSNLTLQLLMGAGC